MESWTLILSVTLIHKGLNKNQYVTDVDIYRCLCLSSYFFFLILFIGSGKTEDFVEHCSFELFFTLTLERAESQLRGA